MLLVLAYLCFFFVMFFFNDTATTEIYTLSPHDALPIFHTGVRLGGRRRLRAGGPDGFRGEGDRKSTRLNSSQSQISYAVFCSKKRSSTTALLPTRARARCSRTSTAPPRS